MADPVAVSGVPSSEESNAPTQRFVKDQVDDQGRRLTVLERTDSLAQRLYDLEVAVFGSSPPP